jgi:Bifunctional DNA primase/polymerase, N-terminal
VAPVAPRAGWRLLVGRPVHVELDGCCRVVRAVVGMSDRRDAALHYSSIGLPVFPCEAGGKAPLTRRGFRDASAYREHVWQWWQHWPNANVAVPTGPPSGWLVVDLDSPQALVRWRWLEDTHGGAAWRTLEQQTGRGRHLIFVYPPEVELGNTAGRLGAGIDTRGAGGYVIVAPSVHPSGRRYRWVWPDGHPAAPGNGCGPQEPSTRQQWHLPRAPAPAPGWLVELLRQSPGAAPPAVVTVGAVPDRLPRHLADRVREAPAGDRSAQTYRLVAAAVEWGLDDPEILALALAHAPTVAKYRGRAAAEASRILGAIRPNHRHVGQPCDRAGCHNRPDWMR